MPRTREPEHRTTLCTTCDGPLTVSTLAKSVSCPHCNTRVITESMDVDGYVAVRRFATANAMRIAKKGIVVAAVRADVLEVVGTLTGDATSMTGITIARTAKVKGDLRASWLRLEEGASFAGHLAIGPEHVPELERLHELAGDPATDPEGTTPGG
jgi:cytoskeletal protein CcmA (bactofilin family)